MPKEVMDVRRPRPGTSINRGSGVAHSSDAQLASAVMDGTVAGVVRESTLSPQLIDTICKDIADQIFLKLLRKDFKDGAYYRTILAHMAPDQTTRSIKNAAGLAAKAQRTKDKKAPPDACICMARVRGVELEFTCLVTPTPEEEFQLDLISQNIAYRVTETSIRLASANLEHIMRRAAQAPRENTAAEAPRENPAPRNERETPAVEYEVGSEVEVTGLVGAPQHNGRRGTVGQFNAQKQRYAVSLRELTQGEAADITNRDDVPAGETFSPEALMISVKAVNLLPLPTPAGSAAKAGEAKPAGGDIAATLWALESKGSLATSVASRLPRCWAPEGLLPACLTEGDLIAKMECVEFSPRPRTLVGETADGTRVQMQVDVDPNEAEPGGRVPVRANTKRCSRVSQGGAKGMGVDELNGESSCARSGDALSLVI